MATSAAQFGRELARVFPKLDERKRRRLAQILVMRGTSTDQADVLLAEANVLLDGHGVEALWESGRFKQPAALYVNLGDTYDTTVVHDVDRHKFWLTSWGNWLEVEEQEGRAFNGLGELGAAKEFEAVFEKTKRPGVFVLARTEAEGGYAPFIVTFVEKGGRYGRDAVLTAEYPMVEFYDTRYPQLDPDIGGQFVARYNLGTMLKWASEGGGLNLQGGVPAWSLGPKAAAVVRKVVLRAAARASGDSLAGLSRQRLATKLLQPPRLSGLSGSMVKVGDRVQIPASSDLWMRGARYGEVVAIRDNIATVKMDHPQVKKLVKFQDDRLTLLDGGFGNVPDEPDESEEGGIVRVERIHINRNGYDSRGRYWGVGEKLWYSPDLDTGFLPNPTVAFTRAPDAKAAKSIFERRLQERERGQRWQREYEESKGLRGLGAPAAHEFAEARRVALPAFDYAMNLPASYQRLEAAVKAERQGDERRALVEVKEALRLARLNQRKTFPQERPDWVYGDVDPAALLSLAREAPDRFSGVR